MTQVVSSLDSEHRASILPNPMVHIPSILALKAQYGQAQYLLHASVCMEQRAGSDCVAVVLLWLKSLAE